MTEIGTRMAVKISGRWIYPLAEGSGYYIKTSADQWVCVVGDDLCNRCHEGDICVFELVSNSGGFSTASPRYHPGIWKLVT